MKQKIPSIIITFKDGPTAGYWNGGKKSGGTFTPEPCSFQFRTSSKGNRYETRIYKDDEGKVKWGCWELNVWYRVAFGKSWQDAAARARNKIKRACKVSCKVEVIWG